MNVVSFIVYEQIAWEAAKAPFMNFLMMGLMMWMAGSTVHHFNIGSREYDELQRTFYKPRFKVVRRMPLTSSTIPNTSFSFLHLLEVYVTELHKCT